MTHRFLLAALASLSLAAAPAPALAGTTPSPPITATTAQAGLSISMIRDWLVEKGGNVSEVKRENNRTFVEVNDGGLTWWLIFHNCEAGLCRALQYQASFRHGSITPSLINAWNIQTRYVKASYVPGTPSRAYLNYDVILVEGAGSAQLEDPSAVWSDLIREFLFSSGIVARAEAPTSTQSD